MGIVAIALGIFGYYYFTSQNNSLQLQDQTNQEEPSTQDNADIGDVEMESSGLGTGLLQICTDECGNGTCQSKDTTCQEGNPNCVCQETKATCPQDCNI